jgi:hypothetical protein
MWRPAERSGSSNGSGSPRKQAEAMKIFDGLDVALCRSWTVQNSHRDLNLSPRLNAAGFLRVMNGCAVRPCERSRLLRIDPADMLRATIIRLAGPSTGPRPEPPDNGPLKIALALLRRPSRALVLCGAVAHAFRKSFLDLLESPTKTLSSLDRPLSTRFQIHQYPYWTTRLVHLTILL